MSKPPPQSLNTCILQPYISNEPLRNTVRYEVIATYCKNMHPSGPIHNMIHHRAYNATACGDGFLGPGVWAEGCRGGFDFTRANKSALHKSSAVFYRI